MQALSEGHDTERRDGRREVPLHRPGLQLRHAGPRQGDEVGESIAGRGCENALSYVAQLADPHRGGVQESREEVAAAGQDGRRGLLPLQNARMPG